MRARVNINYIRIYYNAVFGAIGGLFSWVIIGLLPLSTASQLQLFAKDAVQGAIVGAGIGGLLGAVDGAVISRRVSRLARGAAVGAGVGLVGGAIGLVIGEAIFIIAKGGLAPRALGWAVLGVFVGLGEGVANQRADKRAYGAIGGLLGGLVGGATYEQLSLILRSLGVGRDLALTIGGALGLIILGACIGSLTGLVEDVLRRASFKVLWGPLEGQPVTLAPKREVVIGKADRCDIVLPGDPDMQLRHAIVVANGKDLVIRRQDGPVQVRAAGQWQTVEQHQLAEGDDIRLGRTHMRFHLEAE